MIYFRFFKVATLCLDDSFAHSWQVCPNFWLILYIVKKGGTNLREVEKMKRRVLSNEMITCTHTHAHTQSPEVPRLLSCLVYRRCVKNWTIYEAAEIWETIISLVSAGVSECVVQLGPDQTCLFFPYCEEIQKGRHFFSPSPRSVLLWMARYSTCD